MRVCTAVMRHCYPGFEDKQVGSVPCHTAGGKPFKDLLSASQRAFTMWSHCRDQTKSKEPVSQEGGYWSVLVVSLAIALIPLS